MSGMDQAITDFIKNKNAIIVEDELAIAQLLNIHLKQLGFAVDVCHDAETALLRLKEKSYDLCLLDWMLPGIQGIDFLQKTRRNNSHLKIMMVTAKTDPESIVIGLESGADDYLPKPFDSKVLIARVRNLMRRMQFEKPASTFPEQIVTDELSIHFSKHIVTLKGQDVHLTFSEFKLFETLIKAQGLVLTRQKLIESIQGEEVSVTERTIDTHIFALRKKIGTWSKHIETVRGVGYRILSSVLDITEEAP